MSIPQWIKKTAEEEHKDASVNFSDGTYEKLIDMYKSGKLDAWASGVVEEVEQLRDVMNNAVSQVSSKLFGISKEAAPKTAPLPEKDKPFDIGDDRLKELPLKLDTPETGTNRKLPPKMKEPETTKWKEIRFNKRTGTWQVVVTIRHTRNFMSEDEAVDFTKKAETEKVKIVVSSVKFNNPDKYKGDGYYIVADKATILEGPFADMMVASKAAFALEAKTPGKLLDVSFIDKKALSDEPPPPGAYSTYLRH